MPKRRILTLLSSSSFSFFSIRSIAVDMAICVFTFRIALKYL